MPTWITGEALKPYLHGVPYLSFNGEHALINRLNRFQPAVPFDMWSQSLTSAGARLEFRTPAREVAIRLRYVELRGGASPAAALVGDMPVRAPVPGPPQPPRMATATVSIWRDSERIGQFNPNGKPGDHEIRFALPPSPAAYTVYLPFNAVVQVGGISADGLQPIPETRRRLLAFGDSITHGFHATDPGATYPAIIARTLGLDHYNLGFGGCGRAEPVSAESLTDHAADVITLHFGTNVMPRPWYDQEAWNEAFRMFIKIVRVDHATTPILMVTPMYRTQNERLHELKPNRMGMTLPMLRAGTESVVKSLRAAGDTNLHLLHGTELIGSTNIDLLDDGLHPTDEGMEQMAEVIGARVGELLKMPAR
ncbi:MAG: hypothetical protein EXR67_06700 [Dehalococcoidia bacterium]|nr:hypothetical protein [Dehalococcoidia bacterium]